MWGNPTLSHGQNLLKKKKYWEKKNISTISWQKHFSLGKSIEKKYWGKINYDTIKWEKLFDRFAEHK